WDGDFALGCHDPPGQIAFHHWRTGDIPAAVVNDQEVTEGAQPFGRNGLTAGKRPTSCPPGVRFTRHFQLANCLSVDYQSVRLVPVHAFRKGVPSTPLTLSFCLRLPW